MMTITTASSTRVNPLRVRIRANVLRMFLDSLWLRFAFIRGSEELTPSGQPRSHRPRRRAGRSDCGKSEPTDMGPPRRFAAFDGQAVRPGPDSPPRPQAEATSPGGDVPPETLKPRSH